MSADERIPHTRESLAAVARMHGGTLHGRDRAGVTDVVFPDVAAASSFARLWEEMAGGAVSLRDPVESFTVPVVVQVAEY